MTRLPALLLSLLLSLPAAAQSNQSALSEGSAIIANGSAWVAVGSLVTLVGAGKVVVQSIEAVGEGSRIVLVGASEAGAVSIEMSGALAKNASLAVGASVQVVAMSTGTMLISAGKAIAFIPNEIGKSLLHQSSVRPVGVSP